MCKLGRDDNNQPTPHAHPPDAAIVAQFLAVAEPHRLAPMLENLMLDKQPAYSYAWFVTVALQRMHGIGWQQTKKARAALRVVKARGAAAAEDPQWQQQTLNEIAAVAASKKLR